MLSLALDISCVGVPAGGGTVHVLTGAATEPADTAAAVATNVLKLLVSSGTGDTGDSITLTPHGGAGGYTVDVQTNNDSGFLQSQSVYVCGPISGTTTLRVTDSASNTATVNVVVTGVLTTAGGVLWVRNSDFVSGANNSTPLTDRSPVGGNVTITGGPLTGSAYAGISNKLALDFDGLTQYLATAANRTIGAHTYALVLNSSGTAGFMMHHNVAAASYLYESTSNSINASRGANISGKNLSSNWGVNANFRTVMKTFDGTHAGHKLRINGVNQTLTNGSGTADPGTGTSAAAIGVMASAAGLTKVTGSLASAMALSTALSDTDAVRIESYYRKLFGHY